jgi:hypothetical protein
MCSSSLLTFCLPKTGFSTSPGEKLSLNNITDLASLDISCHSSVQYVRTVYLSYLSAVSNILYGVSLARYLFPPVFCALLKIEPYHSQKQGLNLESWICNKEIRTWVAKASKKCIHKLLSAGVAMVYYE